MFLHQSPATSNNRNFFSIFLLMSIINLEILYTYWLNFFQQGLNQKIETFAVIFN